MFFWETKEEYCDRIFLLSDQGESVTYRQRDEICKRIQKEIKQGNLAFILCRNTIGSVMSYFACLKNRTIPLLLDAKMDYDMIKNLIKEYEPDELFYPKDQEELWSKFGQKGIFDEYGIASDIKRSNSQQKFTKTLHYYLQHQEVLEVPNL